MSILICQVARSSRVQSRTLRRGTQIHEAVQTERSTDCRMRRMALKGRQIAGAVLIFGTLGVAAAVILSGDPEDDMVQAVRAVGGVRHTM